MDVHGDLAQKLDEVLTAVPSFLHHPDLAYAVASYGGDIAENAQKLAGLQIINNIAIHSHQHALNTINNGQHAQEIADLQSHHYATQRMNPDG